jgi:3-phenylpropionate/trans-cinnamate dioxygenase ferredoxin subunit
VTAELSHRFRVASLDELADGSAKRVDIGETPIALVRVGDRVHAIGDTCSHADYSLSEGEVEVDECTLECPRHGATFSLTTGEPETLPATQPVPVFDTEVDGNDIWVVMR